MWHEPLFEACSLPGGRDGNGLFLVPRGTAADNVVIREPVVAVSACSCLIAGSTTFPPSQFTALTAPSPRPVHSARVLPEPADNPFFAPNYAPQACLIAETKHQQQGRAYTRLHQIVSTSTTNYTTTSAPERTTSPPACSTPSCYSRRRVRRMCSAR